MFDPIIISIRSLSDTVDEDDLVGQLEKALALSIGVLHALLELLESKLGPDFPEEELRRLAVANVAVARTSNGLTC